MSDMLNSYQQLGVVPPLSEDGDEAVEEIVHYYGRMTPAAREHFRVFARALAGGGEKGGSDEPD